MKRLLAWWEMARLALGSGYNPRSRYWQWRRETAFGGPRRLSRSERSGALRHFALWTRSMRRHIGKQ